jgi:hypothetical protein
MGREQTRVGIITATDHQFFELAIDLLDSLEARPGLPNCFIGVLDTGMTDGQRGTLAARGVRIVTATWELPVDRPPNLDGGRLAMLCRPFLPKYFPDVDVLLYLDADTWVQEPGCLAEIVDAANISDAVITPEVHTAYATIYDKTHPIRQAHRAAFDPIFGNSVTNPADGAPINAGVIAARTSSPMWNAYRNVLIEAVKKLALLSTPDGTPALVAKHPTTHFIEQNSFYFALHRGLFRATPVSSLYNFICTLALPLYDPEQHRLVEPNLPHSSIRILHLTQAGRMAKEVRTISGQSINKGLRFPDWKADVRPM